MLRFAGKNPLKVWRVKSRTQVNPDTNEPVYWEIQLWGDGKIYCSCPARKRCFHLKGKVNELTTLFGSIQGAVDHYINLKRQKNAR